MSNKVADPPMDWAASVEEINGARDTALLTLGARYRKEVLLPLCNHEPDDAKKHGFDLDAVFSVLNIVDDYNSVFGYYVADIYEEEVVS